MSIAKSIVKCLSADLMPIVYWLGYLVPKNHRLWVFGSGHGQAFSDNSKHLFLYMSRHHADEYRCVWLSRNKAAISDLRASGFEVYSPSSFRGCWLALRAGVAVESYGHTADFNAFTITGATKLVQLWHGTPLKCLGVHDRFDHLRPTMERESERFGLCNVLDLSHRRVFWRLFRTKKPDLAIAASPEVAEVLADVFRLPVNQCKVTGYPRNDALFHPLCSSQRGGKKQVVYLPTWRGKVFDDALFCECDVKRVDALLAQHDIHLHMKLHPVSTPRPDFVSEINASRCMRFLDQEDPYEILGLYDALVTDYSSVYFDYLLLDRPMVFFAMDLESYTTADHELYYDYESVTPGPIVRTWEQLVDALSAELKRPHGYAEERKSVRERFNTYTDDGSSERVFREICSLL